MNPEQYYCETGYENFLVVDPDVDDAAFKLDSYNNDNHASTIIISHEDLPRLIAQLQEAQGGLHVSHSQTISTRGPDVAAVPLAPVVYTLDQFQKAIESLRKDGA